MDDSAENAAPSGEPGWRVPVPRWFWGVAWLCVVWNLLGAVDYMLTTLRYGPYLAQMPAGMAAFLLRLPGWVVAAWALGVWGSLVGALLMVVRVRHAAVAYGLSFAGAVASMTWEYSHGAATLGPGFVPMVALLLAAILFQMWFSRRMFWRGVLR